MPIDRRRYPPNWDEISRAVRLAADNRCQWCGAANHQPHPVTRSRVVLTVAHLDDDPMNNRPENLAALCQRCHLAYDAPVHARHARETWRRKRDARRGQLVLFGDREAEAAADAEVLATEITEDPEASRSLGVLCGNPTALTDPSHCDAFSRTERSHIRT